MSALIQRAVEKALLGDSAESTEHDFGSTHKIVICQRGFVYAGDVSREGDYLVLRDAVNIRRWGTSRGLGELAKGGATSETKSDAVGTVRVHQLAVVAMLDCEVRINATA